MRGPPGLFPGVSMLDTALNHLPLSITFVAILIAHMFLRLEARISQTSRARSRCPRPRFANPEMRGAAILVDPDGHVSPPRRR
jgi:hypothetical protein